MISFFRFVGDLFQLVLRACPNGRGSPDPDVPASLKFNCRLQLAMHRVLGDKTQSSASICRKPRFSRRIRENFPTRSALQHDFASGISQHMEQKEIFVKLAYTITSDSTHAKGIRTTRSHPENHSVIEVHFVEMMCNCRTREKVAFCHFADEMTRSVSKSRAEN